MESSWLLTPGPGAPYGGGGLLQTTAVEVSQPETWKLPPCPVSDPSFLLVVPKVQCCVLFTVGVAWPETKHTSRKWNAFTTPSMANFAMAGGDAQPETGCAP